MIWSAQGQKEKKKKLDAKPESDSQDAMVSEGSTTLPLRGAWRQPEIVHITTQEQPAEIDTGLNKVQLKTTFNKTVCFIKEAAFRVPGTPQAGQSVALKTKYRVWQDEPAGAQVSQYEARVHILIIN